MNNDENHVDSPFPDTIVSTTKLCYSIGEQEILRDIDLAIKSRKITGLLGPNGSGKTTLFRILLGANAPTSGQLKINKSTKKGIIFQSTDQNLIPWKTTVQNILLPYLREEDSIKNNLIQEAVSYLDQLGLQETKNKYPPQLSGGQKQIISIIRWLIKPPDLLFIDEGWSMLDVVQKDRIHDLIKLINQNFGTSIFVVSHDPSELTFLCDCVYLLSNSPGEIVDLIVFDKKKTFSFNDDLLWKRAKKVFPSMQKALY